MGDRPPVFTELPWNYNFGSEGDMWFQDDEGLWVALEIPGDADAVDYVLRPRSTGPVYEEDTGGGGGSFDWQGDWDSGTAYSAGAVVWRSDAIYYALLPSTNKDPISEPTYWDLILEDTGGITDGTYGDIIVSGGGLIWTLDNAVVGDANITDRTALSVFGRASNSSGVGADIVAGANDRLLARVANALAFQQLTAGMVPNSLITAAMLADMVGVSVLGRSANSTGAMAAITAGADDRLLARTGSALSFVQLTTGMVPSGIITPEQQTNAGRDRWVTVQFGDGLTAGLYGTGLQFVFRAGCAGDWTEFETDADASCSTVLEITKNGSTIFTNLGANPRPTLASGTHEDKTSMSNITTSFAKNDKFIVSVNAFTGGTPKLVSITLYYRVKT